MFTGGFHTPAKTKRSKYEDTLTANLDNNNKEYHYEEFYLEYTVKHKYTPDFVLPNGIIVEAKGGECCFVPVGKKVGFYLASLDSEARGKMLKVKRQYPELDIRFVFPKDFKLEGLKTTPKASKWCEKNGFKYHIGNTIPESWFKEEGQISPKLKKKGK